MKTTELVVFFFVLLSIFHLSYSSNTITTLKAKKRIGYSWYSIPEFLVISFADSVAVFDSLSDCSFLCQYWYFC